MAAYKATRVRAPLEAKKAEFPYLFAIYEPEQLADIVYGHLDRIYQTRGKELPATEVARDLEAEAKKRYEEIQGRLNPALAAKQPAALSTPKPKSKTLTNSQTQNTPPDDGDSIDEDVLLRKAREAVAALAR